MRCKSLYLPWSYSYFQNIEFYRTFAIFLSPHNHLKFAYKSNNRNFPNIPRIRVRFCSTIAVPSAFTLYK